MKIYLLLLIAFIACSESKTDYPTGHILQGQFVLTKAVGWEPVDIGGPDIDDPVVYRSMATSTHLYPRGTGRLILHGKSIYLDAPIPGQPILFKGTFVDKPHDLAQPRVLIDEHHDGRVSGLEHHYYEWIGNTLRLEYNVIFPWIVWDLYWERVPYP